MKSIVFVFFCLVSLVLQQRIDAINCYACDLGTDGCGKSFSATGAGVVPTTDSSATSCTKNVYNSNNNAISRGAATSCTAGTVTSSYGYGIASTQYCCTTNLCNGAPIGRGNLVFAMISSVIVLLLIK